MSWKWVRVLACPRPVGGRRERPSRHALALLACGAALIPGGPAMAQEATDWPCVQRLVPRLEGGQMWAGPPLATVAGRAPSPAVEALAERLADPDLAAEAVAAEVAAFARSVPLAERGAALGALFARALEALNAERGELIQGIERYARRQRQLADQIAAKTRELEALRATAGADGGRVAELQASRDWDLRVHTDRQRALRLVCDQPVLLERRAFALARIVQEQLP
jgi:hypothetical protein